MPLLPDRSPFQNCSVFSPRALTLPSPVTATLSMFILPAASGTSSGLGGLGDDEVAEHVEVAEILPGRLVALDLDRVLLLQDRDELDEPHRIDTEVVGQRILQLDLALRDLDEEVLDEDLL